MSYNFPAAGYGGTPTPFTQAGGAYQPPSIPALPAQSQIAYGYPSNESSISGFDYQPSQAPGPSYGSTSTFSQPPRQAFQPFGAAPAPTVYQPPTAYQPPVAAAGPTASNMQIAQQPNNSNRFVVYGNDTYFYKDYLGKQLGGTFGQRTGPNGVPAWSYPMDKYQAVASFVQQANAGQIARVAPQPTAAPSAFQRPVAAPAGLFNPPSPGVRPVQALESQSVTLDFPHRYLGSDGRTYQIVLFTIWVPTIGDRVQVTVGPTILQGQVTAVHSSGGVPSDFTLQNLVDANNVAEVQLVGNQWRVRGIVEDHRVELVIGGVTRTGVELPVLASPSFAAPQPQAFIPAPAVIVPTLPAPAQVDVVVPANTEVGVVVAPGASAVVQAAAPTIPVPVTSNPPLPAIQPLGIPAPASPVFAPFTPAPVVLSPRPTQTQTFIPSLPPVSAYPQATFPQPTFPAFNGQ